MRDSVDGIRIGRGHPRVEPAGDAFSHVVQFLWFCAYHTAGGRASSCVALGRGWQLRENGKAAKPCVLAQDHDVGSGRLGCEEGSSWLFW